MILCYILVCLRTRRNVSAAARLVNGCRHNGTLIQITLEESLWQNLCHLLGVATGAQATGGAPVLVHV
jgi:hypothetical protein